MIASSRQIFIAALATFSVAVTDANAANNIDQIRQKSFSLLEHGKITDAIKSFETTLRRNPRDLDTLLGLARALEQNKNIPEATRYYREILKLRPSNHLALLSLVQLLSLDSNSRRESISLMLNYVKEHPDDLSSHRQLANICMEDKDTQPEAIRQFKLVLQKAPNDRQVLLTTARLLDWSVSWPQAEQYYRRYLQLKPSDDNVRTALAALLSWEKKDIKQAAEQYDILLAHHPGDSRLRLSKAQMMAWNGGGEQALAEFRKLLVSNPDMVIGDKPKMPLALYAASVARWSVHDWRQAEKFYTSYLVKHPEDLATHLELANLYWQSAKLPARAVAEFDAVLRKRPHDVNLRCQKAFLLMCTDHARAALAELRIVCQTAPQTQMKIWFQGHNRSVPAILAMARLLDVVGEGAEAKSIYSRYLVSHPREIFIRSEVAAIDARNGGQAQYSPEDLDKLLAGHPKMPLYNMQKGLQLMSLGRFEAALPYISEASAHEPLNIKVPLYLEYRMQQKPALVALGQCLALAKKPTEAIDVYRQYLKMQPDDLTVQFELAALLSKQPSLQTREQALEEFEKIIVSNQAESKLRNIARMWKADTLSLIGKSELSLQEIDLVIGENEDLPSLPLGENEEITPLIQKAKILLGRGEPAAAEVLLKKYLAKSKGNSENTFARILLVDCLIAQEGKNEVALEQAETIVVLQPTAQSHQIKARVLARLGRYNEAVIELSKIDSEHKQDTGVVLDLAEALKKSGRADESIARLKAALAVDPDRQELACLLADYLAEIGQKTQAEVIYRHLLQPAVSTSASISRRIAAGLIVTTGNSNESIALLRQALQNAPEDAELAGLLAHYLNDKGQFPDAEKLFRTALISAPDWSSLHAGLALSLAQQNRSTEAIEEATISLQKAKPNEFGWRIAELSQAKQLQPLVLATVRDQLAKAGANASADQILAIANLELWHKETEEEGIAFLRRYLNMRPDDEDQLRVLAGVLAWTNKPAESRALYKKLLEKHPGDLELRLEMARAETASPGTRPEAIKHFQQYLKFHPEDMEARRDLANTLCWSGDQLTGLRIYDELAKIAPEKPEWQKGRAQVEIWYKPTQKQGIKRLETYLQDKPDDADASRSLANVLSWVQGSEKNSFAIYKKLYESNPEDKQLAYEYATGLGRAGRAKEALNILNACFAKDFNNRLYLLARAEIHRSFGDTLKAESVLTKARALYPHDEQIARLSALNFTVLGRFDLASTETRRWKQLYDEEQKSNAQSQ